MDNIKLLPKTKVLEKYFHQPHSDLIILRHGHIAINNYHLGDNRDFEHLLSVWDKMYYRYDLKGGYYVSDFKEFRICRGFPIKYLSRFFPNRRIVLDNDAYPYKNCFSKLTAEPNKDIQNVALTHMLCKGEYENLSKYTQQIIDADTGDGKTYCAVAATIFLSGKAIILVPFSKLVSQWKEAFLKFTTMKEEDILIVKGSKMCTEIRSGLHKDKKVFIMMIDTVAAYNRKHGDLATMQMFYETDAYVKIIDEAHKKLGAIIMIEALCNFKMNYYMTASFGRADLKEDKIIKILFRNVPKFGSDFKRQEEKHVNIIIKKYTFLPMQFEINQMYRRNIGLNIKSYEKVLLNASVERKRSFDQSLKAMIQWSLKTIKPENKILILCSTIDGIEYIKALISGIYDISQIGVYHSKISKSEKEKELQKKIIISTDGSLGTGADIRGLEHVHSIITYSNAISAKQLPGRGRKIEGVKIIYIEYVNIGYNKTLNQYFNRRSSLEKNTPTGKLIEID